MSERHDRFQKYVVDLCRRGRETSTARDMRELSDIKEMIAANIARNEIKRIMKKTLD